MKAIPNIKDEIERSKFAIIIQLIITLFLIFQIRVHERSLIEYSLILEITLILMLFRFYYKTVDSRNYTFWGISFVLFFYFLKPALKYSIIDVNVDIVFLSILALIFMTLNLFVMSSPLYFPRVQWWEYDFRYRGDLKIQLESDSSVFDARITDLRRGAASIEAFHFLSEGQRVKILFSHKDLRIDLGATIKTSQQVIQGRPFRFGVFLELQSLEEKGKYKELLDFWRKNNKVKVRNKFKNLISR